MKGACYVLKRIVTAWREARHSLTDGVGAAISVVAARAVNEWSASHALEVQHLHILMDTSAGDWRRSQNDLQATRIPFTITTVVRVHTSCVAGNILAAAVAARMRHVPGRIGKLIGIAGRKKD